MAYDKFCGGRKAGVWMKKGYKTKAKTKYTLCDRRSNISPGVRDHRRINRQKSLTARGLQFLKQNDPYFNMDAGQFSTQPNTWKFL